MKAVAFVLDLSRSMGEKLGRKPKLTLALEALERGLERYEGDDVIAVYAAKAERTGPVVEELLPPTRKAEVGFEQVRSALKGLRPGGLMPVVAALREALKALRGLEGERHVYVITDGRAYVGEHPLSLLKDFEEAGARLHVLALNPFETEALRGLAALSTNTLGHVKHELRPELLHPDLLAEEVRGEAVKAEPRGPVEPRPTGMVSTTPPPPPVAAKVGLAEKIYMAGMKVKPSTYVSRCFMVAVALSIIPLGYALAPSLGLTYLADVVQAYLPPPYDLAALAFVPAAAFMLMYANPGLKASELEGNLKRELPWVAALFTANAAAGIPPTVTMEALAKRKEAFPAFAKLSYMVSRARDVEALDPYSAIQFHADRVSDPSLRDFLIAACTAQRSGADVYAVLREKMAGLYAEIKGRLEALGEKFSMAASVLIMAFILVPMFMLTIGPIMGGVGGDLIIAGMLSLCSFMSVAMALMVDAMLPRELLVKPDRRPLALIPLGLAPLALKASLPAQLTQPYLLAALCIAVGLGVPGAWALKIRSTQKAMADASPAFLRDVAERVKKGDSPAMAVVWLAQNRSYNRAFNGLLRSIAARVQMGYRISEAVEASGFSVPWTARVSLELLDVADEVGADPSVVEFLAESTNTMFAGMRALRGRMRFFKLMSYLCVAMLAGTVGVTAYMVKLMASMYSAAAAMPTTFIALPTPAQAADLVSKSCLGAVYASMCLGLLGGKASDGGSIVDGLKHGALSAVLAALGLYALIDMGLVEALMGMI